MLGDRGTLASRADERVMSIDRCDSRSCWAMLRPAQRQANVNEEEVVE